MSFWSLSLGQEPISHLFNALSAPVQGIAAIPAAALGTIGLSLPSAHSVTSHETAVPSETKISVGSSSESAPPAVNTATAAFDNLSSASNNLFSLCNSMVTNSATTMAAIVAPAAEYVPAPIAALAAYAPIPSLTTPPMQPQCNPVCSDKQKEAQRVGEASIPQTASSVDVPVTADAHTNSPAMIILTALATNPQVQTMLATAITGLISASLPIMLRSASAPAGRALQQTVQSSVPSAPLLATPSPALNNRLNFGSDSMGAALMNVIASRYVRDFGGSKPPAVQRSLPSAQAAATAAPTSGRSLVTSYLPSAVAGLFGTVALPMLANAFKSAVAATRSPSLGTSAPAVAPDPKPSTPTATPIVVPNAALAVVQPLREELKKIALFAGRNAALAVLYYVLVKYFGPAGLSVKVAFTLATLLMDTLI